MTILSVFNILMELLAAAPSAEATVEQAITALHGSGTNSAKTQAVVQAAESIASTGAQIIGSLQPPTPPSPPQAA